MNIRVTLTPDQEAFVRHGIGSGRIESAEDAVRQALEMWEDRERTRASILSSVDRAEDSVARGMGRSLTSETTRKLADDVKRRGRARFSNNVR